MGVEVIRDANSAEGPQTPEAAPEIDDIDLSMPEGISIDDPVRMYLKEIGKVPLLSADEEINIAMRMEKGDEAKQMLESGINADGKPLTDEEKKHFDEKVGLVEASIGRMVPVQTEEMKDGDPMRVCVERYGFLPVDKAAFKGEIPEITNMVPFEPFDFYIKRKLYVHNMGHATCAYLGGYEGRKYIYQSIDDPEILNIVQNAMLESALGLSKKYGVELESLMLHITDLLGRFRNAALKDTCKRVGGDPTRKLGAADRLIGSSLLCLEQGVKPAYIAVGAAGAVYRYLNEAGIEQSKEEAAKVLKDVSGLEADSELAGMILDMYAYFLEGEPVSALRRAAQAAKTAGLGRII